MLWAPRRWEKDHQISGGPSKLMTSLHIEPRNQIDHPDGNLGTGTKAKVLLQGLQLIRMEYDFLNGNTNMVPSRKKMAKPDQVNFQMKKHKWLIQKNVFQLH